MNHVVEIAGRYSGRVAGGLLSLLGFTVTRLVITGCAETADEYPLVKPDGAASAIAFDSLKRIVEVDASQAAETLTRLLAGADILITSGENRGASDSAATRRLGVDFAGTQVDLTPFGDSGPYRNFRASEANVAAFSGAAAYIGRADEEPIAPPFMMAAQQAGVLAAMGVLAALPSLDRSQDRVVHVAEFESLAALQFNGWYPLSFFCGPLPRRAGRRRPGPFLYTLLSCKDGDVCVGMNEDAQWQRFTAALGNPEWVKDPRFQDRRNISERYFAAWSQHVEAWLATRTKDDVRQLALKHRIPFGPVANVADLLSSEQLRARGFFGTADSAAGPLLVPGLPFGVSPGHPIAAAAPRPPKQLGAEGKPLGGLRVLDLGRVIAGPVAAQLLADLGADVIKVESRTQLDGARRGHPLIGGVEAGDDGSVPNMMPYFNASNRGKRSVVLDLRSDAGRTVLHRLIGSADVIVENAGPGGLEKLIGMPVEAMLAEHPQLVVLRISLAGQQGPESSAIGYAPHTTAMGGLDSVCGYDDGGVVGMMGSNFGDLNAALFGAVAVLATLRSGGQVIDLSMVEANAFHLAPAIIEYQQDPHDFVPTGNFHPAFEPHGMYRCAGDDSWISVAIRDDNEWRGLGELLHLPQRLRQLRGVAERRAARDEIGQVIGSWTAARPTHDAFHELQSAGVPCAPVMTVEDFFEDAQAQALGTVIEVPHHLLGVVPLGGCPLRSDRPLMDGHRRAPDLGEHTLEVMHELGFDQSEVETLAAAGAFDGQRLDSIAADSGGVVGS